MVILQEIEFENFKTFRGRHSINFDERFTAVVGVNGAGKSNFADAIGFVMGVQLVDLRVSGIKDLVTFGQEARGMSVSAVLQSEDGSQICFKRCVEGSHCVYYIQGHMVTRHIYVEALKKLNINSRVNNFLVIQNFIETILTKKPSDRTATFEDISGSIAFKAEYDRLKGELMQYQQDFEHVKKIKRVNMTEIKNIQHCINNAKEYTELLKEKDDAHLNLILFGLYHSKRKINNLILEEQALRETMEDLDGVKSHKEQRLKNIVEECRKLKNQLMDIEATLRPKELKIKKVIDDLVEIREKKQYAESSLSTCKKRLEFSKNADNAHELNVRELEHALAIVRQKRDEYFNEYSATLGRDVELSESETRQYERLKLSTCAACASDNQQLLTRDREYKALQDIFEVENTKRNEVKIAIRHKRGLLEAVTKRIEKLEVSVKAMEAELKGESTSLSSYTAKFEAAMQKAHYLENEIANISEELGDCEDDSDELRRMRNKREIVDKFKQMFLGVHGRLSDLCQPMHERYNIAVTKVFGAHSEWIVVDTEKTAIECIKYLKDCRIGIESFLPLDQIVETRLIRQLRDIKDPPNVKLVYDVIKFPLEIGKAVMFATKNALVAETPEDAARVAFELTKRNDCVSLDGHYYRKSGIISGGRLDLAKKARRWDLAKREQLKAEKGYLSTKLRDVLKSLPKESGLSLLIVTIKSLESRLKYIRSDEISAHKERDTLTRELKPLEEELENIEKICTKAKCDMDNAFKEMNRLKSSIDAKENEIFADFCRRINVCSIRDYEKGKESFQKTMGGFDEQISRIETQLTFENNRDTKIIVGRLEESLQNTKHELDGIIQREISKQASLDDMMKELEGLQPEYRNVETIVNAMENSISSLKEELDLIEKEHKSVRSKLNKIQIALETQRSKYLAIMTEAKVNGFYVAVIGRQVLSLSQSTDASTSSLTVSTPESSMEIDFSKLPEELRDLEENDISRVGERLKGVTAKLASELEVKKNLEMQSSQFLTLAKEKLAETNARLDEIAQAIKASNKFFDNVKSQRYGAFMNFFEGTSQRVDAIYKKLTRDPSAQACLMAQNPEEPYLGGILYDCIPPGKRFQMTMNLSGGEKAMAALALLFATQSIDENRPPFQILDEIDAPLDHKNRKHMVKYIQESKKSQQSIIITHRKEVFTEADVLIGINRWGEDGSLENRILRLDLRAYQ